MNDYFFNTRIKVSEEFILNVRNFVRNSQEADWKNVLQMTLLLLPKTLFESEPLLMKIINHFGTEKRLAVYKTSANTSYHWHRDASRFSCLNILLDGYDSLCMFANDPVDGMMHNLVKVNYEPNNVHLLNVTKLHTVMNFDNDRYLLSIGIPPPSTFEQVRNFIQEEIVDTNAK